MFWSWVSNILEKCPIYYCDIVTDEEPIYEGNFKMYITKCLNELKENTNLSIDNAIKDLDIFSDEVVDYGEKFTRNKVQID